MNNLVPVEFNNVRIMTTKVLAEVYNTKEENIKTNFNRNKERFIEGKHYYQLEGDELTAFKGCVTNSNDPSIKFASMLTLWTEKGAARHAKILDTDEAWEVYEELEDTYFRIKESYMDLNVLSPELQLFQKLFNAVAQSTLEQERLREEVSNVKSESTEVMKKAQVLEHRINNLDTTNIEGTERQRLNQMIKKFSYDRGIPISSAWHEFRKAFNTAYKTNIEIRKTNYQGKNSSKKLSYPDYLEKAGLMEDALRVADKMLN